MRINGISLGWIEIVILVVAVSFLFSLMGKNRNAKGGAKFLGFVMFMAAIGAIVVAFKTANRHESGPIIEPGPIIAYSHGEAVYGGGPGSFAPFRRAEKRFIEKHGNDLVECSAVILPPDEAGNTLVRVEVNVDPEWRVFALGLPRDRSVSHTVSQLALAESDENFLQIDSPHADSLPEIDGPYMYHKGRIVWNAPIQLQHGVDVDELQIKGAILAQLTKDGMLMPIDRMFVAKVDRSSDTFSIDWSGQNKIDLDRPTPDQGSKPAQVAAQSNSSTDSNSNSNSNTEKNNVAAAASSAGQGEDVPPPVAPQSIEQLQSMHQSVVQQGPQGQQYVAETETSVYEIYPYDDPAFDEKKEAEEVRSWVKGAADQKSLNNDAFYTTIATLQFHEDNREEMREDFRQKVEQRVNEYIDLQLLEEGASRHIDLPYSYIQENIIKIEYPETGDDSIDENGKQMVTTHARLVFSPEVNKHIRKLYKDTVVVHRIGFFAAIAGMFLAFVGTIYGYFRLDTATKGYYSGRLKMAAIAIFILILAAGSGILEEVGRNGF